MKKLLTKINRWKIIVLVFGVSIVCSAEITPAKINGQKKHTLILTEFNGYPIVDTDQKECFDNFQKVSPPEKGEPFYGQDAQHTGNQMSYTLNKDGLTVLDNITGLTWIRSGDVDDDGDIDNDDQITYVEIQKYVRKRNLEAYGGFNDWRVPSIKDLYSLMDFNGTDPSSMRYTNGIPFINTDYFIFKFGDTKSGDRIIDAQYWSNNVYTGNVMDGLKGAFGLNLADGRIKCYPAVAPHDRKRIMLCRGNTSYGVNEFIDNEDNTISDNATGLMWSKNDCGIGMNWKEALTWVQRKNKENYLGYNDWRLPNAKEMQSIVDYARSPEATQSAAIDPVFNITQITNEAGEIDFPWFWTSTTHKSDNGSGARAVYIAFGRALGYWHQNWTDVHGAGCQRSDPKSGSPSAFPVGKGPQGDAIRIYNYVRCVRDIHPK